MSTTGPFASRGGGRGDPVLSAGVLLRPVANPMALGFVGLAGATLALSGQEIGWIPPSESAQVAAVILLSAPLLQLIACVFGFLARDPVAATSMGLLGASWAIVGVIHLLARPGVRSPALGTFLLLAAGILFLSAAVALAAKVLPAVVLALAALRFLVTGIAELSGTPDLVLAGAAVGCLLAAAAAFTAVVIEFEAVRHRPLARILRRPTGEPAPNTPEEQVRRIAMEPGVRDQL